MYFLTGLVAYFFSQTNMTESSGSSTKTEYSQRAGSSLNPRRLQSPWLPISTVILSEENGGVRLMMSYGISSISQGINYSILDVFFYH